MNRITFTTETDRAHRARTSSARTLEVFGGTILTVVRALMAPVMFLSVYLRERKFDGTRNGDDASAMSEFEKTPTCVVPLSEFERTGCKTELEDPGRYFVLIHHLAYDIESTRPVGLSQDAESEPPIKQWQQLRLVQNGFITDFASIPTLVQRVAGRPLGTYSRAAVVHDWAYGAHFDGTSAGRKACDLAMLALMRQDGTEPWRRALIYVGVRIGGGPAFRKAPQKLKIIESEYEEEQFTRRFLSSCSFLTTFLLRQFEGVGWLEDGVTEQVLIQLQGAESRGVVYE